MAKTRPGIERIHKQNMQRLATFTEGQIEQHMKRCTTCAAAGADIYARCSEWWAMAKFVHNTRRRLRRYGLPETAQMDMLPGMEDA